MMDDLESDSEFDMESDPESDMESDPESDVESNSEERPANETEPASRETTSYPYKETISRNSSRAYCQPWDPRVWARKMDLMAERQRRRGAFPGRATDNCNRDTYQFGREEWFTRVKRGTPKARWNVLAGHVRSLCMSIGVDAEVMEVLASLKNLTSLELVGLPLEEGHPEDAPVIRLPALKDLKLRGYFPVSLVREICNNARHVAHLNLGLLATPREDKTRHVAFLGNETEDSESDDDSDSDEEGAVPWALHSPLWLPPTLPGQMTALTHLHLVRPHLSQLRIVGDDFQHIPKSYEQALCDEWVALLRGTAGTLRELILEHRVPRSCGDTVCDGGYEKEAKKGIHRLTYNPYDSGDRDMGDVLFCRTVLCFLFENSGLFSNLQRLAIRGIQIRGIATTKNSVDIPGRDGVPNNDRLLRLVFPKCDIELCEGIYPIHVYAGDIYQNWPANRHEAMQDAGDGLLYNLSFYNDYRMSYGPQWKVTE